MENYYDYTTYQTGGSTAASVFSFFWVFSLVVSLVIGVFLLISLWKLYKKAGKKGWECIVPIYNIIVLLNITNLPTWNIILFFIPIANIYIMFKVYIELAHKFGKSTGFGVLTVFFPVICLPILAFSKNCNYQNSYVDGYDNASNYDMNSNIGDYSNMEGNLADSMNQMNQDNPMNLMNQGSSMGPVNQGNPMNLMNQGNSMGSVNQGNSDFQQSMGQNDNVNNQFNNNGMF